MYVFVCKKAIVGDLRNNCETIIPFKPIWRKNGFKMAAKMAAKIWQ